MEKNRTFETIVGILVLVVSVFFFRYIYIKSNSSDANSYVYVAKFNKADGLAEGTDVKIAGIKVGKIINTEIDPRSFFAIIKFSIKKQLSIPKDSSAVVASDGLFGGKYLSIVPGGEDVCLKEGEEIENTVGPINIESLIGQFMFAKNNEEKSQTSTDKSDKNETADTQQTEDHTVEKHTVTDKAIEKYSEATKNSNDVFNNDFKKSNAIPDTNKVSSTSSAEENLTVAEIAKISGPSDTQEIAPTTVDETKQSTHDSAETESHDANVYQPIQLDNVNKQK